MRGIVTTLKLYFIIGYLAVEVGGIGACRPGRTQALPGLFWIMCTHITRTRCKDTWSPAYSICVYRCMYSIQCSDKIRFPQLHIKCGVAKSCPGTDTALQVPMVNHHYHMMAWCQQSQEWVDGLNHKQGQVVCLVLYQRQLDTHIKCFYINSDIWAYQVILFPFLLFRMFNNIKEACTE